MRVLRPYAKNRLCQSKDTGAPVATGRHRQTACSLSEAWLADHALPAMVRPIDSHSGKVITSRSSPRCWLSVWVDAKRTIRGISRQQASPGTHKAIAGQVRVAPNQRAMRTEY